MKRLHIRTGCRLHFGLMELAAHAPHRYAGLGVMLSQPHCELTFSPSVCSRKGKIAASPPADSAGLPCDEPAERSEADEMTHKIVQVVNLRRSLWQPASLAEESDCSIHLSSELPLHTGLGAGTQLAAAVATGLELFARLQSNTLVGDQSAVDQCGTAAGREWRPLSGLQPAITAEWLARYSGRGLRSAVGMIGFLHGGLILDEGYCPEVASEVDGRPVAAQATPLADAWRVVLITPPENQPISGEHEARVMTQLGASSNPQRNEMLSLANRALSLATGSQNFDLFVDCLDRYMQMAASLFSPFQAGMYNGPEVAEAVKMAQSIGLRGVGQSSWGPTVFGMAANNDRAHEYAVQLQQHWPAWSVAVCTPSQRGAQYRISDIADVSSM